MLCNFLSQECVFSMITEKHSQIQAKKNIDVLCIHYKERTNTIPSNPFLVPWYNGSQ